MNSKRPLITVYITNYNYAKFIRQSIESVLNQTMQDFELLIIDDGSTDNSREIIEEYRDHEKIDIIYQQNKGLNVTNNIALRVSNGKYIMRLDADDFLTEDALELMTGILEQDDEIGLVFPDYYLVDENGTITEEFKRHNFTDEVSLMDQAAHGACTVIRVKHLRALGGYNESFSCQDGYELWVNFIAHYKVRNVNKPLFYYRRHSSNLTRNETRILSTRAKINELYTKERFGELKAVCIIPVRDGSVALKKLGDRYILEYKIEAALAARVIRKVVISSPSEEIRDYVEKHYGDNDSVVFHQRSEEEARLNVSLVQTVNSVLQTVGSDFDAITIVAVEYPFVGSYILDDAINTMFLFDSDSLVSVRQESRLMFQHLGDGMHPIMNQDKFTKLERESLYKLTGGIYAIRTDRFLTSQRIAFGKIGHIMIDQISAMGLFSDVDWRLAEAILQTQEKKV